MTSDTTTIDTGTFEGFMEAYHGSLRTAATVVVHDPDAHSPFVILEHGSTRVIINPMVLLAGTEDEYLNLDTHVYVDGQRSDLGVMAMSKGARHSLQRTGATRHGWASADMVVLFAGGAGEKDTRTVDHTDAATYQPSDYAGVTLADLVEIQGALSKVPATLQVSAVLNRVAAAVRRQNAPTHVSEAYAARNARSAQLEG